MHADMNAFAAALARQPCHIFLGTHCASNAHNTSSQSNSASNLKHLSSAAGTLQAGSAYASLQLHGGRTLKAKLVVGSDGGNSKVRQMAQLRTVSWSYKQRGLVATVATDSPNTSGLQVFMPNGPLALLPVRDGFSNIVWSTTPAQAAELEAMPPDIFIQEVNMVR